MTSRPAPQFTDEDLARVESWRDELWNSASSNHVYAGRDENYANLLTNLLAYIEELEAALREIADFHPEYVPGYGTEVGARLTPFQFVQRLARAALDRDEGGKH